MREAIKVPDLQKLNPDRTVYWESSCFSFQTQQNRIAKSTMTVQKAIDRVNLLFGPELSAKRHAMQTPNIKLYINN